MFDQYIYEFFFINLKDYPNIKVDFEINVFLFILAVAIAISSVVITIYRSSLQDVLKQLNRFGAIGEDSARTLPELGLDKRFFLKLALSREGRLRRIVGRVGEKIYTYEEYVELSSSKDGLKHEKFDFATAQFYIRPERIDEAKNIINNYSTSMVRTLLYCVLIFAFYVCTALLMPEILTIINDLMASA